MSSEGEPINKGRINIQELGDSDNATIETNSDGSSEWNTIPYEAVNLTIFAQGYKPLIKEIALQPGKNDLSYTLERDPHGKLTDDFLENEEKLIFYEDFQDGEAIFLNEEGSWQITEAQDDPENIILDANQEAERFRVLMMWVDPLSPLFIVEYSFRWIDIAYTERSDYYQGLSFGKYQLTAHITSQARQGFHLWDFNENAKSLIAYSTYKNFENNIWYRVRVEGYDDQLTFYLNDEPIGNIQVSNDFFPEDNNFISISAAEGTHVQYDDLLIKLPKN